MLSCRRVFLSFCSADAISIAWTARTSQPSHQPSSPASRIAKTRRIRALIFTWESQRERQLMQEYTSTNPHSSAWKLSTLMTLQEMYQHTIRSRHRTLESINSRRVTFTSTKTSVYRPTRKIDAHCFVLPLRCIYITCNSVFKELSLFYTKGFRV